LGPGALLAITLPNWATGGCPFFSVVQMENEASTFVSVLLHSGTNAHLLHWTTSSFAAHQALGEYYKAIPELVDQLAEAYMGRYGQFTSFPDDYYLPTDDPVEYMEGIKYFVQDSREIMPDDSEIQNLIDEIAQLIDSTLFKLRFLK
jgi:DNA-binding ferritin-like protein